MRNGLLSFLNLMVILSIQTLLSISPGTELLSDASMNNRIKTFPEFMDGDVWAGKHLAIGQRGLLFTRDDSLARTGKITVEQTPAHFIHEAAIQIGTFREESNALALKERISAAISRKVEIIREDGLHKVRVSGFENMEEMGGFIPSLRLLGIKDIWILPVKVPDTPLQIVEQQVEDIQALVMPPPDTAKKRVEEKHEVILVQIPDFKPDTSRKNAVNIFLDCRNCDMNYTRQEIPYVNYVRDFREAGVYIKVTNQPAGSGGNQYTYTFTGQKEFAGMNDTIIFNTSPDQTSSIIREKRTNILKMGLMRYVARTPLASEIRISHNPGLAAEEVEDRWRNWVFEISSSPWYFAEETAKRLQVWNSVNISKITPDLKLDIDLDQSSNKRRFIDDSIDTTYVKSSNSLDVLIVKSLGDHWSAGIMWDNGTSSEANYNFYTEIMPAIEYDLFPYSEATHKQLRILYSIGYMYSNYIDSTVYDKIYDNFFKHELRIAYQIQEKWGSINISLTESNILTDPSKNAINLYGNLRLRILKGLSLSLNGGVSYNNFQPNLRKGEISEADRLLQLKQLASSYSVRGGASLSYTFGSIYNNVVNPRFGNGGSYNY